MLDKIIEIGAAIFAANWATKKITGKHIHEHAFRWWCDLREKIKNWLHANNQLNIQQVGIRLLDYADTIAVGTKRAADKVTLQIFGEDAWHRRHEITTRVVSWDEAVSQFPELRQGPVLMQTQEF
ncbi:MAG TPA: hypothetical protein VIW67_13345 [Terriglobales bacterium]|jgi:hypothetical protein